MSMATAGPLRKTQAGSLQPSFSVMARMLTKPTLFPNISTPRIQILSTLAPFSRVLNLSTQSLNFLQVQTLARMGWSMWGRENTGMMPAFRESSKALIMILIWDITKKQCLICEELMIQENFIYKYGLSQRKFQVIPFNIQYFQLFSPQILSDDPLVPYQQQIEQYQQVKMLAKPKDPQYDKWIQALIIVTFDIDQGQKISHIIPGPVDPQTDKEISMLAFPDSNSFGEYQGIFKYLFKTKDGLYGFVCFKQKKDANNKRGYSQKSFVVLTRLPFLVFFQKLVEFLVFKLLALDEGQLHQELVKVKNQSQKWPQPQPLTSYILPVLDYQIAVDIPNYVYDLNGASLLKVQNFHSSRKQSKTSLEQIVTQQTLLQFGRFQEVKLTEHFDSCYEELWLIWETVMLNRPLLIMSDNPHRSSQAVLAAISLMNPLEYGGEFYPYVTVYDTHLNQLENAESDVVFGATNPLFLKLFASNRTTIVQLGAAKVPKHLKPLKELFVKSKLAEQKIVNQSALRKYFYKVNCGIISIVQEYAQLQTNDLKFFNEKDFLRFVRKREGENVLSQVFDDRRYSLKFWQEFTKTFNFSLLLRSKNMVREKC